jgi:hypothetical protein
MTPFHGAGAWTRSNGAQGKHTWGWPWLAWAFPLWLTAILMGWR